MAVTAKKKAKKTAKSTTLQPLVSELWLSVNPRWKQRGRHRASGLCSGQAFSRYGNFRRRRPVLRDGTRSPLQVKPGDVVLFTSYGPTKLNWERRVSS